MNTYRVEVVFERTRDQKKSEIWCGQARNMLIATRRAAGAILKRASVKRLRHRNILFRIEKLST